MFSQAKQSLGAVFKATVRDKLKSLWRKRQTQRAKSRAANIEKREPDSNTAKDRERIKSRRTEAETHQLLCILMQKQKLQEWNMFNNFTVDTSVYC